MFATLTAERAGAVTCQKRWYANTLLALFFGGGGGEWGREREGRVPHSRPRSTTPLSSCSPRRSVFRLPARAHHTVRVIEGANSIEGPLLGCGRDRVLAMHSDHVSIGRPADCKKPKGHGRHVEAFDNLLRHSQGLHCRPSDCCRGLQVGKRGERERE